MNRYTFTGSVIDIYDRVIEKNVTLQTVAGSAEKARSNMAYQYKKNNNFEIWVKIRLVGKLTVSNSQTYISKEI